MAAALEDPAVKAGSTCLRGNWPLTARLMRVFSLLRGAVKNFYADSGLDLAAAVAFYSLLSIGPVLYLLGATVGSLFKNRYSTESLLANLSAFVPDEVMLALGHVNLGVRADKGLVFLALPALLWGAIRGFTAIGRALNRAFGSTRRRDNLLARLKGLAILAVGLLLLGLATAAASLLPRLGLNLEQLGLPKIPLLLDRFSKHLLSPIVSYVTFTLFYKFLPAARVSWRPALWGGLLTVLLWEGARLLFSRFLAISYGFGLLSGSLAAIIGFLLWTYTGMAILLLGAELASILNGRVRPSGDSGDAFTPAGVS